eukprot:TRINITY_DN3485_c0_g2_i1.p1 TRINITY_DN3485_c0_g2~~TRINITY_DN3485_c0_g2_i1.p1  ORF type:complete len:693 (+),score=217.77 TRINITY_DN3485_c0_g2_i1:171-2249(+)
MDDSDDEVVEIPSPVKSISSRRKRIGKEEEKGDSKGKSESSESSSESEEIKDRVEEEIRDEEEPNATIEEEIEALDEAIEKMESSQPIKEVIVIGDADESELEEEMEEAAKEIESAKKGKKNKRKTDDSSDEDEEDIKRPSAKSSKKKEQEEEEEEEKEKKGKKEKPSKPSKPSKDKKEKKESKSKRSKMESSKADSDSEDEKAKSKSKRGRSRKGEKEEEEDSTIAVDANGNQIQVALPQGAVRHRRAVSSVFDAARFARTQATVTLAADNIAIVPYSISKASPTFKKSTGKRARVQNKMKLPHKVPTLQELSMHIIAEYIDSVESFGVIPPEVQQSMCTILARKRKLNSTTLPLFLDSDVRYLRLAHCGDLDPMSLSWIAECKAIRGLHLSECGRLTDKSLQQISTQCSHIEDLNLDGAYQITEQSLVPFFKEHPNLKHLSIAWSQYLTTDIFSEMAQHCHLLESLKITHCPALSDAMISKIAPLANLKTLHLHDAQGLTSEGIDAALGNFANKLEEISFIKTLSIDDAVLTAISKKCPHLRTVVIEDADITDEGIVALVETLPDLNHLTLGTCKNLTETSIQGIGLKCSQLLTFKFKNVATLTPFSISVLIKTNPRIREMDLSWCRLINDEIVDVLIPQIPLRQITLWGCSRVSDVAVTRMLEHHVHVIGKDQFYYGSLLDSHRIQRVM